MEGAYVDDCCIPGSRSAFFNSNKKESSIGFLKLAVESKIRKNEWLQVITEYAQAGGKKAERLKSQIELLETENKTIKVKITY